MSGAAGPALVPALIVTGPVGVGKTSVAYEVSAVLAEAGVPHACLDIDTLRFAYPAPASDPFNLALGFRNLAAVWRNFQAAGALRLVCADVIEDRATLREYERAIPGLRVTVARLRAPVDALEDVLVETEARSLREIALEVLARAGWPRP